MNDLKNLYKNHEGKSSDKWEIYLNVYDELLADKRTSISSILEIGVQNGGSLEIWDKYFSSLKHLVGCDINPDCKVLSYSNPNVNIVIGDSKAIEVRDEIVSISSSYDIIIDDGSHISSDIIKSFLLYFPLLSDDGIYIIEDLHASYWEDFEGGLYHPYSSMSYLKNLADVVNFEHWGISRTANEFMGRFCDFYNCDVNSQIDYSTIHSITFINSLCVIRKKTASENILGPRHIAGNEWHVFPSNKKSHGRNIIRKQQDNNKWSQADIVNVHQQLLSDNNGLKDELELQSKFLEKIKIENLAIRNSNSWRITKPFRIIRNFLRRLIQ